MPTMAAGETPLLVVIPEDEDASCGFWLVEELMEADETPFVAGTEVMESEVELGTDVDVEEMLSSGGFVEGVEEVSVMAVEDSEAPSVVRKLEPSRTTVTVVDEGAAAPALRFTAVPPVGPTGPAGALVAAPPVPGRPIMTKGPEVPSS